MFAYQLNSDNALICYWWTGQTTPVQQARQKLEQSDVGVVRQVKILKGFHPLELFFSFKRSSISCIHLPRFESRFCWYLFRILKFWRCMEKEVEGWGSSIFFRGRGKELFWSGDFLGVGWGLWQELFETFHLATAIWRFHPRTGKKISAMTLPFSVGLECSFQILDWGIQMCPVHQQKTRRIGPEW